MAWYKERKERYIAETSLIRRLYPSARIGFERGRLVVLLKIRGRKATYYIKIEYPDSFPYALPKALILEPKIKKNPHQYNDKSLCFYPDNEGPQISGKIMLDWTIKWIIAYENWLDGNEWPDRIAS
jgi:hypothetical protein